MATGDVKTLIDLDEVQDVLKMTMTAAEKLQFETVKGYVKNLLTLIPALKSNLRDYVNTMISIAEGLKDQELTRQGAKLEAQGANVLLEKAVSHNIDKLGKPSYDPEDLYKDLDKDTLKVYDEHMNQVQIKIAKGGVFTGYVPVLPLTKPSLDFKKLRAAGIPTADFAGYSILQKEFVAGISIARLNSLAVSHGVKPKRTKDKQALPSLVGTKPDLHAIEVFSSMVVKKFPHLKLIQMGNTIGYWGAIWFWFATAKEYEKFKHCTLGVSGVESLKILKWDFPFNRSTPHPK